MMEWLLVVILLITFLTGFLIGTKFHWMLLIWDLDSIKSDQGYIDYCKHRLNEFRS